VGFGIGSLYQKGIWQNRLSQTMQQFDALKSQYDTLNSQIESLFPPLPEKAYNASGVVINIGDNYLEIEAQIQVDRLPLSEGNGFEKKNLKVYITKETEIFWLGTNPTSSSKPTKVLLTLKDIVPGTQVYITTKEDIKTNQEVVATKIQVI